MRRFTLACLTILMIAAPAHANDAANREFDAMLSLVASRVMTARVLTQVCDEQDPPGASDRKDALASWLHRNDIATYDEVLAELTERMPKLKADIATKTDEARKQITAELGKGGSPCADMAAFLKVDTYDIHSTVRKLGREARNRGLVAQQTKAPEQGTVDMIGLAQLSVRAEAEMSRVGSRDGAQKDRNLREAREKHLEAHFAKVGAVAGFGRVVSDDRLREWRDDRQSRFALRCRNFLDASHKDRMGASIGKDMVIIGQPRSVSDRDDGEIALNRCMVLTLAETGKTIAATEDDAGFILRPLEAAEAFAGANKGIAAGDVFRVLYIADFQNRMDGFGNGYTRRDEDVYVLLDDGTAYHHTWAFPFTDLNVALSKKREPERWLTWTKGWTGTITLTRGDEVVDTEKAQTLHPMDEGARLNSTYYYLNVGAGGVRRDADMRFEADGTVAYKSGALLAGNFATSYMIAVPKRDGETTANYRFDGYALVVDGPDGERRDFFALTEKSDDPGEVIIGGKVHWKRKDP